MPCGNRPELSGKSGRIGKSGTDSRWVRSVRKSAELSRKGKKRTMGGEDYVMYYFAARGKRRLTAMGKRVILSSGHPVFDHACVAQLAEQLTRNEQVAGSNPATSSKREKTAAGRFFPFC